MRKRFLLAAAAFAYVCSASAAQYHIPYFLSASNPTQQSFLRLTWITCSSSWDLRVTITAVDDEGTAYGPLEFLHEWCDKMLVFNSTDLEYGNPDKGLPVGVGPGVGDWQLFLKVESNEIDKERDLSSLDLQSFIRTSQGFLTAMHDVVPNKGHYKGYYVGTFNPGRNTNQKSRLRLVNPHDFPVNVRIHGMHDGSSSTYERGQRIRLPTRGAITVTAQQLETYHPEWEAPPDQSGHGGYGGVLGGDPGLCYQCGPQRGKWRLRLKAQRGWGDDDWQSLIVMNLMETQTGHLTNLSSFPPMDLVGDMPSATAPSQPEPNPPSSDGTFDIEVFFANGVGEVPRVLEYAYRNAARRWERVIARGFDNQTISLSRGQCHSDRDMTDREIDDLLVIVRMANLGGYSGSAASAAPCLTEDGSSVARRPFVGWVDVNVDHWNDKSSQELSSSQPHPLVEKIAIHELGHVLGFYGDQVQAAGHGGTTPNMHFSGPQAREAFWQTAYDGRYNGEPVPMEFGHAHWHEEAFTAGSAYPEIMAPAIAKQSLLSKITVAALADLGYDVDFGQVDTLPWGWGDPGLQAEGVGVIDLSRDVQ